MWRWSVLLCLLIFYGHSSSQPVAVDSENARPARQLDFGECCPCPGSGQGFAAQESSMPSDGLFARSRDIDDCPCRPRSSDSEGASSMFFPTSRRSDDLGRSADKKEDMKPLLHPEVDLASSVLQTLREATEEEYEDALARDAARSMAKAAEETIFGDAVPEASNGNIVTIIVNPKHADSFEEGVPQESHVQESRCVHAPLESGIPNLGQMRVAEKPPNLLREFFGLPRISKSTGLLHKNLLDMDNEASNIQERVVQVNDDQTDQTNKNRPGLRKYAPLMKFDKNIIDKSTNLKSNEGVATNVKKVLDFKLPPLKKLKDLLPNRSDSDGKENVNTLPLVPKMRFDNPSLKAKGKDNEDLSFSPSNIHEQAKKSFFQTKSHLENLFQKTKPVDLKTLLKLKDVEFVPLKDLIPNAAERPTQTKPKFAWPNIFNKVNKVKNQNNMARSTEIIESIPKSSRSENHDTEVSPSNIIEQINDDNCIEGAFKKIETDDKDTEAKTVLSEIKDATSSPSEIQEIVNDASNNLVNSESNELPNNTDDCNMKTLADTETNLPQSTDSSSENLPVATNDINNEDELNFETSAEITPDDATTVDDSESEFILNDEDCINNTNDDSRTDSSNNVIDILKPSDEILENVDDSMVNQTPETQEPCSEEVPASDTSENLDINPTKLIKPLSIDKTLSTIKENIRKHIESLKTPKSGPKTKTIVDQQTPSNIVENIEFSRSIEKLDSDCQNEESLQVTTVKPDNCNEDLRVENEPKEHEVSMQDLQKISDDMLQEEQERESKGLTCNEPAQEVIDPKVPIQEDSAENQNADSETSPNTQSEVIMEPQNTVNISDKNDNDLKNTCKTDLKTPIQSLDQEPDAKVEASEFIMRRTPQMMKNDFSLNIPLPVLPDIKMAPLPTLDEIKLAPLPTLDEIKLAPLPTFDGIKLAPLPTLDEIKVGLTNLFDTPARNVEDNSALEAASLTDTSNIKAPVMSTDASAKHFQSLLPPLRLEDVDLDILQLNPHSNLFSEIPKLDLHSFRTKLPLPTDLRIKPLKLQSAFEDNGGLFGATLSLGQNNPWEIPSLDTLGTQMKANSNKIANSFRKPGTLRLKSSQGIGDLSKIRGSTTRPVNLQSNDLLEAISRNHEDVSDKLKALHIDFNDRLETMRNNLFDKSLFGSGESRSTKSFSTFSTKDKKSKLKTALPQSLSSRRESKKTLKPQRQKETRLQNKFKMPTSASVPVPKTVEVPELKATLVKSPGLGIQRTSGVNPIFGNIESSQPKESTLTLWKQASKKLPITNPRLGKTNLFKDSKIKVSFSTTLRPALANRLQSRKLSAPSLTSSLGRSAGKLGQRTDHKGSQSEIKHSIISHPLSSPLDEQNFGNYGLKSESRQTGALITRNLVAKDNLEQPKMSKDLQSWPKVSESAFLSKVKEAVEARMSKINSPGTFKNKDGKSMSSSVFENGNILNSNTDMARSASTNIDIIEGKTLKENVSYKCTMVCTKD